jgi:kynurenine formamidase
MDLDKSHYESGKQTTRDGQQAADDVVHLPLHGTTHVDALGHAWYDDELYNGFDANTTKGGLDRCSIAPIAEHGIVGRGVLIDIARYREVDTLEHGARITLDEIQAAASDQSVDIQQHDILLLRTGFLEQYYKDGPDAFYGEKFREPGVTYSDDLVAWFHEMEIPVFGTDTLSNEQTLSDVTSTFTPLHAALLRDQGVIFNEMLKLDELAADCETGEDQAFLFIASPLKFVRGTGSPVNPLAIR